MSDEVCRFFVPGPVWVRPELRAAMARPIISHRSPEFRELFASVAPRLRSLFRTTQHAFVATSSGTGLLEAAVLNCVPRRVLVTTCGAFSERWASVAEHLGIEIEPLRHEWGKAVDPQLLANHLAGRRAHYDAVCITHNETSTGVINDLATLAGIVHDESDDSLVIVDAVSSLAGTPVLFDEWGLDVCLASSQKALGLPPGITVFAVSDRAMERAAKKPYRGTYFDFLEFRRQSDAGGAPFTPSVPHCFALADQLEALERETLESRWERHVKMRDLTLRRTSGYAEPASDPAALSPTVTALRPKSGDPKAILDGMRARGYSLGSGYGEWKESTFRIGHMGDVTLDDLSAMLDVLEEVAQQP
ncbi:MAG: pyridoxal-phosphate-dependent aminotransferase family protein [Thermoanaerobaculia bacterium]